MHFLSEVRRKAPVVKTSQMNPTLFGAKNGLEWQDQKRWAATLWPELNDVKCQCAGCWLVQFSDKNAVLNYCCSIQQRVGILDDFGRCSGTGFGQVTEALCPGPWFGLTGWWQGFVWGLDAQNTFWLNQALKQRNFIKLSDFCPDSQCLGGSLEAGMQWVVPHEKKRYFSENEVYHP